MRSAGIAVMGSAIPVRRCLSARPSGLPIRPSWVDGLVSAHAPLFEFRGPSGRFTDEASRTPAGSRRLLWTFVPFGTCGDRGPVHPGIALPGTCRPQGLATLATVFSLDCLARLISCGQRPWGSPFGAFSSLKVVAHSCTIRPACRYCGLSPRRTEARRGDKTEDRLPGASFKRIPCGRTGV